MKLLLHICCGPCSTSVIPELGKFSVTGFYYNPNIFPEVEFEKRYQSAKKVAEKSDIQLIAPDQTREEFFDFIKENKSKPQRCLECYRQRLDKTAEYAKENNFQLISTTLLISPYQAHEDLRRIGEEVASSNGVAFHYQDFRPLFKKSREYSEDLELYLQKYCGCKYSRKRR